MPGHRFKRSMHNANCSALRWHSPKYQHCHQLKSHMQSLKNVHELMHIYFAMFNRLFSHCYCACAKLSRPTLSPRENTLRGNGCLTLHNGIWKAIKRKINSQIMIWQIIKLNDKYYKKSDLNIWGIFFQMSGCITVLVIHYNMTVSIISFHTMRMRAVKNLVSFMFIQCLHGLCSVGPCVEIWAPVCIFW